MRMFYPFIRRLIVFIIPNLPEIISYEPKLAFKTVYYFSFQKSHINNMYLVIINKRLKLLRNFNNFFQSFGKIPSAPCIKIQNKRNHRVVFLLLVFLCIFFFIGAIILFICLYLRLINPSVIAHDPKRHLLSRAGFIFNPEKCYTYPAFFPILRNIPPLLMIFSIRMKL